MSKTTRGDRGGLEKTRRRGEKAKRLNGFDGGAKRVSCAWIGLNLGAKRAVLGLETRWAPTDKKVPKLDLVRSLVRTSVPPKVLPRLPIARLGRQAQKELNLKGESELGRSKIRLKLRLLLVV